jgi:hypothetical protein
MNGFFVLGIGTGVTVFASAAFLYSYEPEAGSSPLVSAAFWGPPTALLRLKLLPFGLPPKKAPETRAEPT